MENEKLKENYRIVIVKIIDYLGSQQTQNNVNESYGSIRVNDSGIYFEEKTNNRKK